MSKNYGKDVPLTKDGHPDRRTKEGREAAAAEEGGDRSNSGSNQGKDVPLTKDGHPDRRTKEGREAAAEEGGDKSHSESSDKNRRDSPQRNLDGSIDKRTVEGRAAVAEGGDNKGSSSSSSHSSKDSSSSSHSSSQRRDDRYRKGHKFEEGETVVFHIGKHEIHGKISKVNQKSGEYKVAVGDNTITASEKELQHDEKSKSSSGSSSGGASSSGKASEGGDHKFNEGDNVTFNIGLNELHGTITRVITDEDVVDGRVAHGSKDEPRYAVEYEGTGVEQIRTEGALKKDDDKMDEDKSNKRKRDDENSKDSNKDSKEAKSPSVKEPSPKKSKSSK